MKLLSIPVFLLLLLPLLASAAAPRAWLDRDTVRLGETVTLNIEVEGLVSAEPDFSVLDAQFDRLGVSSRSQMSLVNGQRTASTLWAVALEPREAGLFTVPAIPVGDESTAPLRLTVQPAVVASAGEDVFMEVDVAPDSPYVQQQVRLRIKLYYGVTLLDGQLDEPNPSGAELRRLGNDLSYQTQIDDRRYNVVERRFALIPEASGELVIPAVRFRGRAMGGDGRFGPSLSSGRQVSAGSEPITLQVRPSPAGMAQSWLPAAQLELTSLGEEWPETIRVGEPLSLELRVAARGLDGSRLPELELPQIEGLDIYPDQPVLRTGEDGEWLQGERRQRFALVPQRVGDVVLPEVRLAWWNTEADRAEIATLPARRIRVMPAAASATVTEAAPTETAVANVGVEPVLVWPWQVLSAALLAAWMFTLVMWWRQRPAAASLASAPARAPGSPARLRGAILRRDPQAFEAALLAFASDGDPAAGALGELVGRLQDSEQHDAIEHYLRSRWRGGEIDWARLSRAFARSPSLRSQENSKHPLSSVLPPLYPEHRRSR